jgi:hypothetical protein
MARKQLAGLLVTRGVGQLRVDGGVLDIGMAQPVFDKGKVSANTTVTSHCVSTRAAFRSSHKIGPALDFFSHSEGNFSLGSPPPEPPHGWRGSARKQREYGALPTLLTVASRHFLSVVL